MRVVDPPTFDGSWPVIIDVRDGPQSGELQ